MSITTFTSYMHILGAVIYIAESTPQQSHVLLWYVNICTHNHIDVVIRDDSNVINNTMIKLNQQKLDPI